MSSKGFTHLHLHTQYSLLDGAVSPKKLFKRCKELGMDSVAITDHGNMFGAVDFYKNALSEGIKPIIGIEAYVAPGSRTEKSGKIGEASHHLVLLAENLTGYKNLLKLSSQAYTEGFYYRPRMDKELLTEFSEGIIACSACISGEIPRLMLNGEYDAAQRATEEYIKIFGEKNFYLELQKHDYRDGARDPNEELIDLSKKLGVGLVATNDVHFLTAEDYEAHDALTCISTGKLVHDSARMKYPKDVYLKSPEEMYALFPEVPEACSNTVEIANRCNVEIELGACHAPVFKPPQGKTDGQYLTELVYEGAKKRYGEITEEVDERIKREIEVIDGKGFSSYFLIVWDFCNWATENGIPVGARGSGVGTIVGYCLGLCNVDPIKYGLLFERFMDPQRNEMPDIDIDICQDGRPRLLEHVRNKYGEVAQITTFGTMKAKAVVRDVCRVLNISLPDADKIAKLIPNELKITLEKALLQEPDLKTMYDEREDVRQMIEIGKRLEGLTRHASVHACAVVIADEPLSNFLPLYKMTGSEDLVTQFEGPNVEAVGLLKMDFLGLRTLSIIERAKDLVKDIHGVSIDIEAININEPKVFEIFGTGRTKGVFQFESGGMADLLMKMRPDRLEDLIAANALYRPGPMTLIPEFIARKHGGSWNVPHPIMHEILEETFGIMIYQEQVMKICNELGGIGLRDAYGLIKAISKKKEKIIAASKEQFVVGCKEKGLTEKQANDIFDLIERFAGYGFNKSHSARYAIVAYQTAYLKAYWPTEFMAALLTYETGSMDKIVEYIGECKAMGLDVLPPDINESFTDFTVVYEKEKDKESRKGLIRFGLGAVKGVGGKAVEQIIIAREKAGIFKSLFHFCENVDLRAVNKQVCEALIKAGAFDRLGGSRSQMMVGLEAAMRIGSNAQADLASGQMNLFGGGDNTKKNDYDTDHEKLPDIAPWPEMQMLKFEKDVLGLYVTSNPLSKHAETIGAYSTAHTDELGAVGGKEVCIGGMITKIRNIVTKNGKNAGAKMAVAELEDLQGKCEIVLFPRVLAANAHKFDIDNVIFVKGTVDTKRETPNILVDELIDIEEASDKLSAKVKITLKANDITREKVDSINSICQTYKGKSPVYITILHSDKGKKITAVADREFSVRADREFRDELKTVVGENNFDLTR